MSTTIESLDSTEPPTDASTVPFPYGERESGTPLSRYRTRGRLYPDEPTGAVGSAGDLECPACSSETVDGAGLFACTSCSWTGSLR